MPKTHSNIINKLNLNLKINLFIYYLLLLLFERNNSKDVFEMFRLLKLLI